MSPAPVSSAGRNRLFYGDNLDVLRRYVEDESIDLIYLDPPFNSESTYNVFFPGGDGKRGAASQLRAFGDTWEWNEESSGVYSDLVNQGGPLSKALQAFWTFLGDANLMAYLAMMAPRLVELRRVLKPTGGIYLHCDPTASHYLKILLDAVFGPTNFKNDISWTRATPKSDFRQGATNWARIHDVLLYYVKDEERAKFRQPFAPYSTEYIASHYGQQDDDGRRFMLDNLTAPGAGTRGHPKYELMGVTRYWRYNKEKMQHLISEGRVVQPAAGKVPRYKRYLDEMPGVPIGDMWADIGPINSQAQERLGYQTQKPEALLDRIIQAHTDEGDVVLDPFCGCGTSIASAHRLKRKWIGIDVTQAAIVVIKQRFRDHFSIELPCEVIGEPVSLDDANVLADTDPYQFQWWALGLVDARPAEGKKGADRGIDGRRYFHDPVTEKTEQIIFSVKAGHVNVSHMRDLRGVVEREKATMGVLISMEDSTKAMRAEAASAGVVSTSWGQFPRLQVRSIAELMLGNKLDAPPARQVDVTYKRAPRAQPERPKQQTFANVDVPGGLRQNRQ